MIERKHVVDSVVPLLISTAPLCYRKWRCSAFDLISCHLPPRHPASPITHPLETMTNNVSATRYQANHVLQNLIKQSSDGVAPVEEYLMGPRRTSTLLSSHLAFSFKTHVTLSQPCAGDGLFLRYNLSRSFSCRWPHESGRGTCWSRYPPSS